MAPGAPVGHSLAINNHHTPELVDDLLGGVVLLRRHRTPSLMGSRRPYSRAAAGLGSGGKVNGAVDPAGLGRHGAASSACTFRRRVAASITWREELVPRGPAHSLQIPPDPADVGDSTYPDRSRPHGCQSYTAHRCCARHPPGDRLKSTCRRTAGRAGPLRHVVGLLAELHHRAPGTAPRIVHPDRRVALPGRVHRAFFKLIPQPVTAPPDVRPPPLSPGHRPYPGAVAGLGIGSGYRSGGSTRWPTRGTESPGCWTSPGCGRCRTD
jgi:hypothetical protein